MATSIQAQNGNTWIPGLDDSNDLDDIGWHHIQSYDYHKKDGTENLQ
ncbi:MAG: hypothetical protein GWP06_18820 [Actinobacteria bacterium]|nr:hypothetical protein [Actinomycetota bacterium]